MDYITGIGSSALSAGAVVWLFRSWISERLKGEIKSEYDMKLEVHKAELKASSDIEIEKLRSELGRIALEHGVKYTALHEKRGEVLAELYRRIRAYTKATSQFSAEFEFEGDSDKNELAKIASEKSSEFRSFYLENKIYFTSEVCEKIDELWNQSWDVIRKFGFWLNRNNENKKLDAWEKAADFSRENLPLLLESIEDEFREILGVIRDSDD